MGPWSTGHAVVTSTARAGRILRRFRYEVSARGDQPWRLTPRDRLEIDAFRRDVDRARGSGMAAGLPPAGSGPDLTPADLDALAWADAHPAIWSLASAHPISCCLACHFEWEEREIWPYLSRSDRTSLQADHDRLRSRPSVDLDVRRHAARETMIAARSGVPARLMASLDSDHRRLDHG